MKNVLCLEEKVVEGIEVDISRGGGGCQEAGPLPPVVLCIEQEVGAHDGHAHRYDHQNHKHEQHEAVNIVDLVGPERRKDEIPETPRMNQYFSLVSFNEKKFSPMAQHF
jgi:hypothetical protein